MYEEFKQLLVSQLDIAPDDIKPESELTGDLGINSLELADLVLLCEDKYNVEIDDDDIHKFVTVKDVVDYLNDIAK